MTLLTTPSGAPPSTALLTDQGLVHSGSRTPRLRFLTTGSPELFAGIGRRLMGGFVDAVEQVYTLVG